MSANLWAEALGYSWTVGHRLKKSRKVLPIEDAKKYYKELKARGLKSVFARENIPLHVIVTMSVKRRAKDLEDNITQENPLLRMLKQHGALNKGNK
jgi:hypothetical protein